MSEKTMTILQTGGVILANISYIRVSSVDQNLERQRELLKDKYILKEFSDKMSGKDTARPGLKEMLDFIREGDTLYIESISRLSRNTADFLRIFEMLRAKGVRLVSLKEGIDTETAQGKFMLTVFAAFSELEREYIRERQREGIDLAKKEGRPLGRPTIKRSKTFESNWRKWKAGEITAVQCMRLEGLKRCTFYKLSKELEEELGKTMTKDV